MRKFTVTGMSCAACSSRVEKAVRETEGVDSCAVNLLTGQMSVEGRASDERIISAVVSAGYGCAVSGAEVVTEEKKENMKVRLSASAILLLCLMYVSMGHEMLGLYLPKVLLHPAASATLQLLLSLAVIIINRSFFISGLKSVKHLSPNMDALVSLGSGVSFIYSAVLTVLIIKEGDTALSHSYLHGLYYESSAMILTLITVGKLLEAKAKGRTTDAIESLMKLSPEEATVIKDGVETVVPVSEIRPGDLFVLKAGDRIPVDGKVSEGGGAVDEGMLTGESIPVEKTLGSDVSAGCLCLGGHTICVAEKVGEDTILSGIVRSVTDASATKAPIARIADKVSGVFVPTVMGIAVITAAVWLFLGASVGEAVERAVTVLVISCPCALGLATPVAIMVGSGVGAVRGILFRTAEALEVCGRVNIVALDKTGTVTEGHPTVTDVYTADGVAEAELLSAAYSLENKSSHPLSEAVKAYCLEKSIKALECEDFSTFDGGGISGTVSGHTVKGGNITFAGDIDGNMKSLGEKLSNNGKTPMFFSRDGKVMGIIAAADRVREDSREAVRRLKNAGLRVVMITGDNRGVAEAVSREAGIDETVSSVLPGEKAEIIKKLKRDGRVAMIGDGINDAPALTVADVGIAIGGGTDIAVDSADVVLMRNSLIDGVRAINLSRSVLSNIYENLFWAFFYNILGIPLAAGVFSSVLGWELSPMFGAAAMSLSSFCVVTNALRLKRTNIDKTKKLPFGRQNNKEKKNMEKVIKVEGMMCPHCEGRVKNAVEALEGVTSAEASHKSGTVTVTMRCDIPEEVIEKVITEQGYRVVK